MHGDEFRNIDNDRSSEVLDNRNVALEYDPSDLLLSQNLVSGRNSDAYKNKEKRMIDKEKHVLNRLSANDQAMFDHITKHGKGRKKFMSRHILSLNNPEITATRNSTLIKSEKVKQQQTPPMPKGEPNNRTKRSRLYTESDLNAIMKIIEGRKIKDNNRSKFITDKELNEVIDNYYLQNPQLLAFDSSKNDKKTNTIILSKNITINQPATASTNSIVLNRTHPTSDSYQTRVLPGLQNTHGANIMGISKRPPRREYRDFHPEAPYNKNSTINIHINSLFTIPGVPKGMNNLVLHIPRDKIAQLFKEKNSTSDINIDLGDATSDMNGTQPPLLNGKKYRKDGTYSVKRNSITNQPPPITEPSIQVDENKDIDLVTEMATPYTLPTKKVPKDGTYSVERNDITYQPPPTTQRSIQMGENKGLYMITGLATPYTLEPKTVPKDTTYSVKRDSIIYEPPPTTQPSIQIEENRDQDTRTEPATLYTVAPKNLPLSNETVIPSETMNKLKYLLGIRSANQSQSLASLQEGNATPYFSTPSIFLPQKPLPSTMPSSYAPSVDPQYDNMTLYSISLNGQKRNISQSAILIFNKKYDQQKSTLDRINGTLTLKPSNSTTTSLVNKSKPISLEKLSAEVESLHNKINVAFDVHKKEILKSSLLMLRKQNDKHQETLDEMNKMASNDVFRSEGIPQGDHMENKSKSDDINKNVDVTPASKMLAFVDRFIQQSKRFNSMKDRTAQKEDDVNRDAIKHTNASFKMSWLPGANKRFRGQKSRVNVLKDISGLFAQNTSSSFPLAQMVKLHPIKRRLENGLASFANISRLGEQLIDLKGFLKTIIKRTNKTEDETVSNNQHNLLQIRSQDAITPMLTGGALGKPILRQGIYDLK